MKLQKLPLPKTVNGQDVEIHISESALMMDGAAVAAVNLMSGNGVIHVIEESTSLN